MKMKNLLLLVMSLLYVSNIDAQTLQKATGGDGLNKIIYGVLG